MPLPTTPFILQGGCNCRAIRYKVSVPDFASRPPTPYRDPGAEIGDLHLPMICIDHCNDCRAATGSVIPMWICAHVPTISICCAPLIAATSPEKQASIEAPWQPAAVAMDPASGASETSYLTFYKSSPARTRSFCRRCETNISYGVDADAVPADWGWPPMLDIVLGTLDREDLQHEWLAPERRLWCENGIGWVRDLVARGARGIPAHPQWKINAAWRDE